MYAAATTPGPATTSAQPRTTDFYAAGGQGGGAFSPVLTNFQGGDQFEQYMQQAIAKMQEEEKSGKGYLMPYYRAGGEGLQAYLGSLGLTGGRDQQKALDTFKASPSYRFALEEAQRGAQRGIAAAGMTGSGAEAAELQRRAEGTAEQEYGGYQQRLSQLAGMGQQTAGILGQLGLGYAGDVASLYSALGKGEMERQLAEEQMEAQEESGFWGALGKIGGAVFSHIPFPT
jgi:hypothetical protein